jgi:hypothetical protein
MQAITTIGLDIAKSVFQVHGRARSSMCSRLTPRRGNMARGLTPQDRHGKLISFKQEDNQPGCSQEGVVFMCDYSLHLVASRPAKIGDKLVTTKFNALTGGFAGVQEPTVAVCLLPGTEVAFETEVKCEHVFKVSRSQKLIGQKVARFRQINMEEPDVHHDALEFPNGQIVLLTRLSKGQHATVLQLPASPRATNEVEQQKRGSLVT